MPRFATESCAELVSESVMRYFSACHRGFTVCVLRVFLVTRCAFIVGFRKLAMELAISVSHIPEQDHDRVLGLYDKILDRLKKGN